MPKMIEQSPITDWVEGDSRALTLTIPLSTVITGTPTAALYDEDGTNLSSTKLSSTSCTTNSVNTVTTGTVSGLKGGVKYWLAISAVSNGNTGVWPCEIICKFPWRPA